MDHGVFVPLMLMYPETDISCIRVSLQKDLRALNHLQLGQALSSLEQEDLVIFGSGFSFYNMQAFIQGPEIERADSEYIAFEA